MPPQASNNEKCTRSGWEVQKHCPSLCLLLIRFCAVWLGWEGKLICRPGRRTVAWERGTVWSGHLSAWALGPILCPLPTVCDLRIPISTVSFGFDLLVGLCFIKAIKRHATLPLSPGFARSTPRGLSLCGVRVSSRHLIHSLWCERQNIIGSGGGGPPVPPCTAPVSSEWPTLSKHLSFGLSACLVLTVCCVFIFCPVPRPQSCPASF